MLIHSVLPNEATSKNSYLANQHLSGENRLPTRTLLLPAQKAGITHKNFTESDRVQLLNGTWKFFYLPDDVPNETSEEFHRTDLNDAAWDDLPVPSMWQFHGYGTCYYPNVRYCFPYDPPYVHRDNPVGLYRLTFTARNTPRGRAILRFLGVDSAYFVWLNGQYVGFSKGSRLAAEFDVTNILRDGENLLAVKVYSYNDGSYLENQDMLLASGIFRDVMLLYTGDNSLWDYTILPEKTGFTVKYTCTVGKSPASLRFSLADADQALVAYAEHPLCAEGTVFLPLENGVEWNAEHPYLYTLITEVAEGDSVKEVYTKKVGIARSEIQGHFLTMNGHPITLKGVNRHDNNPHTGRAITAEQIERELREIKANGLNAIRCSHYTNQPVFYELASELGIYVMDEADCESHGAEATGDRGALNKDPDWYDAFFDRISRMYLLNKNETCIHIWSLGNECGAGQNDQKCAEWLASQDVKKPIRADGDPRIEGMPRRFEQTNYMGMDRLLKSKAEDPDPLIIVEYAHAMGNSPGGLEDIWSWIYQNEQACGGYVWEYKNHGFYAEGKDGRPRYLYGGDFPELYHWANFSLDGFHTSDGTPKPSWQELGELFAPVFVRWETSGVHVRNTCDFTVLDGVTLRWSVKADGIVLRAGEASLDGLHPHEWKFFALPLQVDGAIGLITADCEFYSDGRKIAHKQTVLADIPEEKAIERPFVHEVESCGTHLTVKGEDFSVRIQKGLLCGLSKDGKPLLDAPMKLNCWRAPTDNDGNLGGFSQVTRDWESKLVRSMEFGCYRVEVTNTPTCVTATAMGKFLPLCHTWGFDARITYRVTDGGVVDMDFDLNPYGDWKPNNLPRVGVYFTLDPAYTRCDWLGRGPGDSYPDRKAAAPIGLYTADVKEMNFQYDMPQETGNRQDSRRVTVSGGDLSLTAEGRFSFSFHDFTLSDLTDARHRDELDKSEEKYLYIDHRHRGIGSGSCGPQPEAEYELPMGSFSWSFRLRAGS